MHFKTWKRLFWIALIILILLVLFTVGRWFFLQLLMAFSSILFTGGVDETMPDYTIIQYLSALPNSPLGDLYIVDFAVLLCSSVALLIKRKKPAE